MNRRHIWPQIIAAVVMAQLLLRMHKKRVVVILATKSERHMRACLGLLEEERMLSNVSANTMAND
jgi:hypothetical protein